ncbi:hypothetical protein [Microbispora sp. ATCC PTA-5024]|uniref:hypothetical protein n=1 Tax=Microbispora sp. ATCC PTA-5024 TaxID=316330 RepID=UPI0003DCFAFC|nr:hypothetical protein [Microbispora sp. ATCC PTA-5024]ETK31629.1 hypothetical protein MPTA5024_34045 [Microbispora sp. ATCC PTA-5024]
MPDRTELERLGEIIDELFLTRAQVTRRDLYAAAGADDALGPGVLELLNEVPEGGYTHHDLVRAVNAAIERRGEEGEPGLLEVPPRLTAVEDTVAAERAIEDDTPLEALNPDPSAPPQDVPEFREPEV